MIKQNSGFTCTQRGEELAVRLTGEIDHHSAAPLRTDLDRTLRELRPSCLVLDLSSIDFMDSSGLGLILGRLNLMHEMGGTMRLRSPGPRVERVLRLAGLERLLPIEYGETQDNVQSNSDGTC